MGKILLILVWKINDPKIPHQQGAKTTNSKTFQNFVTYYKVVETAWHGIKTKGTL